MPPARDASERFHEKYIIQPNGCWLWTAGTNAKGYGQFQPRHGQSVTAHRWAWEQLHDRTVPAGFVLDHFVCDTPSCVNPHHVRPTSSRANVLRSDRAIAAINARKTHCKHGHEFTEDNTLRIKGVKWRRCRACHRAEYTKKGAA